MLGNRGGDAWGICNLLCSFAPRTIGLRIGSLGECIGEAGESKKRSLEGSSGDV
jgi:hypothetical protein